MARTRMYSMPPVETLGTMRMIRGQARPGLVVCVMPYRFKTDDFMITLAFTRRSDGSLDMLDVMFKRTEAAPNADRLDFPMQYLSGSVAVRH